MPLDAICLTAVARELRQAVTGAKVDKIYQPTRDEVILHLRAGKGNARLLLSANPQHPRAHLTQIPRENPDTPPMFCMLLRKYFLGGRILDITQPSMERLLELRFETLSELGDRVERRLVLECIGRTLRDLGIRREEILISNKLGWKRVPLSSEPRGLANWRQM